MNKIFKVIWNHATQSWVATSELSRSKGKTKSKSLSTAKSALAAAIAVAATSGSAYAATAIGSNGYTTTGTSVSGSGKGGTATSGSTVAAVGGNWRNSALVIGENASSMNANAVVIGTNASATMHQSVNTNNQGLVVIGTDALVRNVSKGASKGAVAIGGNSLSGLLTDAGAAEGTAISLTNADYATNSGNLDPARLMYRAGITDATGATVGSLTADEATAIGFDSRAIGDQSVAIGAQVAAGHGSVAIGGNDLNQVRNAANLKTYKDIVGKDLAKNEEKDSVYKKKDGTADSFYETTYAKDGSVAIGVKAHSNELFGTAIGSSAFVQEGAELGTAIGTGARVGNQTAAAGEAMTSTSITSTKGGVAIAAGAVAEGDFTTAVGTGSNALAVNATALGYKALANKTNATAVGAAAIAAADNALAYGANATSYGENAVAIGTNATVTSTGDASVAMGNSTSITNATNSVAIGNASVIANGTDSIAIGNNATIGVGTTVDYAIAIGTNTTAGTKSISMGLNATSTTEAVAIGPETKAYACATVIGYNSTSQTRGVGVGMDVVACATSVAIGYSTETGVGAVATGFNASAIGQSSIATGYDAVSTGSSSIAIGWTASSTANDSIGIGFGSKALSDTAVAIGRNSNSTEAKAVAIAENATATGASAIAMGVQAKAQKSSSIAIGQTADANGSTASIAIGFSAGVSDTADSGIAIGGAAKSFGERAVALGRSVHANGTYSVGIGTGTAVRGAGSSTVGYSNVIGSTSSEVSAFGSKNLIGATATFDSPSGVGITNSKTIADTAAVTNSKVVGNNNYISSSNTYVLGSGVGVKDDGISFMDTVENSVYLGNDSTITSSTATIDAATAGTVKNLNTNGDAGATSTAGSKGTVTEANVSGLVYGDFAGATSVGAVSVGASGSERRIVNMAAGEISATSTDAINGSQLYATNKVLGNVYNSTVAAIGATVTPNDPNTGNFTVSFNLTGTDPSNSTPTEVTYTNISSALTALSQAVNQPLTFTANTNADTGTNGSQQELGSTIAIIGSKTNKALKENADAAVDSTYSAKNIQTVVTDNQVQIQMAEKPEFKEITVKADANDSNPVVISSGAGSTGGTISNLTSTLPGVVTVNTTDPLTGNKIDFTNNVTRPEISPANLTNAATLGDVLNAGWNLQGNGKAVDFVKPYDTVNFVDGNGTTIVSKSDGNVSTIQVDVNVSSLVGDITNGETNGNGTTTIGDNNDGNKLANISTIVDAINKSGFTLTSNATTDGVKDASSTGSEIINPGDKIEMIAGKNMTVKQEADGKITYSTKDSVEFSNVNVTSSLPVSPVRVGENGAKAPTNLLNLTTAEPNAIVTAKDLANYGWVVATPDNGYDAAVKSANTVNFIGDNHISVTGANNATTGTYDVKIELADAGAISFVEDTTGAAPVNTGAVKAGDADGNNPTGFVSAKTVANAINGSGWNTNSTTATGGAKNTLVNPGEQVNFEAGKNMVVTQKVETVNGVDTISYTYATADDVTFNSTTVGGNEITYTDAAGNPVTKNDAGDFVDAQGNVVDPADVITKVENPITIGTVNGTNVISNLTTTLPDVVTTNITAADGTVTTPFTDSVTRPTIPAENLTNAATLGDVLNAGWNLQGNGSAVDFVKPYDTVNFVNGTGTTAVLGSDGNVSTVTYNVNVDNKTTEITYVDANGDAVTKIGDKFYKPADLDENGAPKTGATAVDNVTSQISAIGPKVNGENVTGPISLVNGDTTTVTNTPNGIKVEVNTGEITPETDGSVTGPVTPALTEALKTAEEALAALPDTATEAEKKAAQDAVDAAETAIDNAGSQVATAQNVADAINASGWRTNSTTATGPATETLVNPGEQVNFEAGKNMVVTQKVDTVNGVDTISYTYATADDVTFNSTTVGGNEITYTDAAGNPITKNAAGDFVDAQGNVVDPADVITNVDNPITIGTVDGKNVISNLTSTLPSTSSFPVTDEKGTVTAPPTAKAPITAQEAAKIAEASGNNAATLGDVLNAGWNLQGNGKEVDFVKPYDTVNFVNGQGTTAVLGSDGNVSTVTYNVNVDNKTTEITYADDKGNLLTPVKDAAGKITGYTNADGSPYTGPVTSQISAIGPKVNGENVTGPISLVNGDTTTVTNTPDGIKVEVNTGEITPETNGSVTGPVTPALTNALEAAEEALAALPDTATEAEKKAAQDAVDAAQTAINNAGSQVATAQNVADAINGSGWRTNSTTATGTATETLVNPGEQVNFEAGKNMVVTQKVEKDANGADVISYTYATTENVTFSNAVVNQTLSLGDVTKPGAPVVNMTAVNASTPVGVENGDITPAINMSNATFTGLAPNLPTTVSTGNASTSTTSQAAPTVTPNQTTNAATLGDVLNAGWNLQENGKAKDFVKPYDTVNFVNGTGTTANITTDGNVSNVTYNVNVDNQTTEITYTNAAGDTIYKLADGTYNTSADGKGTTVAEGDISGSQVSAKTSPLTNNVDGTVNKPANPKALATAGDVANAINNSGFTLTTSNTGGGDVSGTSKEVIKPGKTVTIDAGKNISVTQNAGTITVATKKDVEFDSVKAGPVTINNSGINAGGTKITNVKPGEAGTDAVNVNQLKQVAGDIHNKINRNNKDLRAGIAGANAAAGLPQVYIPGKSMVAASAGTFKGQSAVAVGYSRASDNGKLILKLQGNANTRGDVGGSVGVGYQW